MHAGRFTAPRSDAGWPSGGPDTARSSTLQLVGWIDARCACCAAAAASTLAGGHSAASGARRRIRRDGPTAATVSRASSATLPDPHDADDEDDG